MSVKWRGGRETDIKKKKKSPHVVAIHFPISHPVIHSFTSRSTVEEKPKCGEGHFWGGGVVRHRATAGGYVCI